ncbi:LysR family transcriptional regulator [Bacillaceae bacterium]
MELLDLKNVLTFLTVAQEKSFVQAAQILHLSQPSVTARIQALETELGAPLFIRNNRRTVQLSKAGEAFLPFAVQLLEIMGEAEDKLKRINSKLEGKIAIGSTAFLSAYVLPEILGAIYQKYPQIEFKVVTGNTLKISEMLMQNQVDVGLVSSEVKKQQIKQVYLGENEMVLVCSPQHPFAKQKVIDVKELLNAPLVTYEQSSDAWKQIKKIYAEYDEVPNVAMELNQIEAAKAMVMVTSCVCILPNMSVEREVREGRLVKVHVRRVNELKTKYSIIYLEKQETYPLISLIVNAFKRHFKVFG